MSRLLILTQPEIVAGFHLAGVDALAAGEAGAAEAQIMRWLEAGEQGLLAIDVTLYEGLSEGLRQRLLQNDQLPLLVLPDGKPASIASSSRQRLAELIRQAIGFHITFQEAS